MTAAPPPISRVLETAVYVDDLERSLAFYDRLFAFPRLFATDQMAALDVGGQSVFLIFVRGSTAQEQSVPGGVIPPHDGEGRLHLAFPVDAADLATWERRLADQEIAVEGRVEWPRGGVSIYFRDPDGHLLELATPGLWSSY